MERKENHSKLIRPEEVADILRLSKPRIYQLAEGGIIPSVKIGKSTRFLLEDVNEFIRASRRDKRDR
jgi:excisionase family DNA binding protein